jgi:type I restriction enzyme, S subunit
MRSGWRLTTLGDVAEVIGGGTPSTKVPDYWDGDIPWVTPSEVAAQEGTRIATTDRTITRLGLENSSAHLLPKGTVLVTSRATIGAVAIAERELATNQGFASLIPGPDILPEFLMYWCQGMKDEFIIRAGGNTFLEISRSKVKEIPIALPPLPEQRRVTDLIHNLDIVRHWLSETGKAARDALSCHLESLQSEGSLPLGTLVQMRSGPSWRAEQETLLAVEEAEPVISITNTKPNGRLDTTTRRFVVGLPPSTWRLTRDSLIMIRTNGNRERIGNVYRVTPEAIGCAVSAFQIILEPVNSVDSTYLYWFLQTPTIQDRITAAASGTTGLGNIAVTWLRELEVPWPSLSERNDFVALAESIGSVQELAEDEFAAAYVLRTALLDDLLSGATELPASYDLLLETH